MNTYEFQYSIDHAAFSSDNNFFAVATGNTIILWSVDDKVPQVYYKIITNNRAPINKLEFRDDILLYIHDVLLVSFDLNEKAIAHVHDAGSIIRWFSSSSTGWGSAYSDYQGTYILRGEYPFRLTEASYDFEFCDNNHLIISGETKGIYCLWDVYTKTLLKTIDIRHITAPTWGFDTLWIARHYDNIYEDIEKIIQYHREYTIEHILHDGSAELERIIFDEDDVTKGLFRLRTMSHGLVTLECNPWQDFYDCDVVLSKCGNYFILGDDNHFTFVALA